MSDTPRALRQAGERLTISMRQACIGDRFATERELFRAGLAPVSPLGHRHARPGPGCLLLFMAVFADFFAPVDPKQPNLAFAPPDPISFLHQAEWFQLRPVAYAIDGTDELDPVTFQPIIGPDYDNPRPIGFFVKGYPYRLLGLIPSNSHFFGTDDGRPFICSAPTSSAATSCRAASSARASR